MPAKGESLSAKVQSSFSELSAVAAELNAVSDELGKSITELDEALRKLNLGITVWVDLVGSDGLPEDSWFYSEEIGYAKMNGRWGIALRTIDGDYNAPEEYHKEEAWLFNDGPRPLRLSAIKKIPEVLEKLSQEGRKLSERVKGELENAKQVAAVVKEAGATGKTPRHATAGPPPNLGSPKEQSSDLRMSPPPTKLEAPKK
jgi:hypothetical protein